MLIKILSHSGILSTKYAMLILVLLTILFLKATITI